MLKVYENLQTFASFLEHLFYFKCASGINTLARFVDRVDVVCKLSVCAVTAVQRSAMQVVRTIGRAFDVCHQLTQQQQQQPPVKSLSDATDKNDEQELDEAVMETTTHDDDPATHQQLPGIGLQMSLHSQIYTSGGPLPSPIVDTIRATMFVWR